MSKNTTTRRYCSVRGDQLEHSLMSSDTDLEDAVNRSAIAFKKARQATD
jgi:hypothetical protein